MGKYFGTDGFRGEANVGLTADHAYKIGKFLGFYFSKKDNNEKCNIAIGKDTRRSSYMFEYALAAGITSTGANALLLHVTTTPSVSYIVRSDNLDAGVMISASHNIYYDNGIKILNGKGEKMEEEILLKIEDYLDGKIEEIPFATKGDIGRTFDYSQGRNRYIGYLISIPMNSFKGYKVALDLANGAAFSIAKAVFDALGAKTLVINNEPNGDNINNNAGSTHIEALQKFVLDEKCDIGFAYDGDADRCIAVDEDGSIVDGDSILYICGSLLKEKNQLKNNTIVTTVMSNLGLYKALDKINIQYEKTDVGDKYVYECIRDKNYSIGGEQSGHIIFSKYAATGDGILTSLQIMETIIERKKSIKELLKEIKIFPQILKNVKVTDKQKCIEDKEIINLVNDVSKELGNDGRVLLRKSGTENLIRIMVEAKDENICKLYIDKIYKKIEELKYIC
ncbi:MAG: phosphoglucosamine mutase [Eubacteriales bacterium]|nr:phosphoglucosamine mutase [Eubacteriales bacterium]